MPTLFLVLGAGAALLLAYFTYGRWLSHRVFNLDPAAITPAHERNDKRDFVPTAKSIVFGHHFTSIAGTGPIVGPAIAVMWGWLPAILWVVFGAIFIGAVHDLGSLVISLRKQGRSIGDIAGDLLGPRARLIFLAILILGLWIVLAIFGLVIASVLRQYPAAVFPVLFQTPLAVIIGVLIHRKGGSIVIPSIITLALMYLSVIFGDANFGPTIANLHSFNQWAAALPIWVWVVLLLAYSYIASVLPVWLLLQPRDYINALQLLTTLALIVAGLITASFFGAEFPSPSSTTDVSTASAAIPLELVAPMINWQPVGAPPLFPVLFITIACGACSGFHCLVGSGATSKQVNKETDAKAIGYGSMLTEGFLATLVIAACAAGIGLGAQHGLTFSAPPNRGLTSDSGAFVFPEQSILRVPTGGDEHLAILVIRSTTDRSPPRVQLVEALRVSTASDGSSRNEISIPMGAQAVRERKEIGSRAVERIDLADGSFQVAPVENTITITLTGQLAFNKQYESWSAAGGLGKTVAAFVQGAANFLQTLGIPLTLAVALIAVMVASFAATTMDTACRLQRYVIQELAALFLPKPPKLACPGCGYDLHNLTRPSDDAASLLCPECGSTHSYAELATDASAHTNTLAASRALASSLNPFKWLATTHGATLFAVVSAALLAAIPAPGAAWTLDGAGKGGLILWPLFGATNQLLAGFAFVVILAWLRVTNRPSWFIVPPAILMLIVPAAAMVWQAFIGNADNPSWITTGNWLLVAVASFTLALEAWLIIEAILWGRRGSRLLGAHDR